MTYPWPTLMPMGIVVISCVRPSVQPSMGLGLCIAYKALGRNGLQFGMLMYPDGLHSAFMDAYGYCCWSVCPSICPFVRLGLGQRRAVVIIGRWLLPSLVDTGDICCHYWQHILVYYRFCVDVAPVTIHALAHNLNRKSSREKSIACRYNVFHIICQNRYISILFKWRKSNINQLTPSGCLSQSSFYGILSYQGSQMSGKLGKIKFYGKFMESRGS